MSEAQTKRPPQNRVWIELERPRDAEHAKQITELANRMLDRLREPNSDRNKFYWDGGTSRWWYGGHMGATELGDNGTCFNLDYLGR